MTIIEILAKPHKRAFRRKAWGSEFSYRNFERKYFCHANGKCSGAWAFFTRDDLIADDWVFVHKARK